jgi:hypothetical protein
MVVRRRKLGSRKPKLRPHGPLAEDEVKRVAIAGRIEFHSHDDFQQFKQALDFLRGYYLTLLKVKEYSRTDHQIAKSLGKVKHLANQLRRVLDDPALRGLAIPTEDGARRDLHPDPTNISLDPLHTIEVRARTCLKEHTEWSARRPDAFAIEPAAKPALDGLLIELVHVWWVATGTVATNVDGNSSLIPFLQEAVRVVAQHPASTRSANNWARECIRYVSCRPIDRGYMLNPSETIPANQTVDYVWLDLR